MFPHHMWGMCIIIFSWSDINFSICFKHLAYFSPSETILPIVRGEKPRRPLLISSKLNGSFMEKFSFNLYDQIVLSRTRLWG